MSLLIGVLLASTTLATNSITLGGLEAKVPANWKDIGQKSSFRVLERCLDTTHGSVEISVVPLAPEARSGVEGRVKQSFQPPPGKTINEATSTQTIKTAAASFKVLTIHGTYRFAQDMLTRQVPARPSRSEFAGRVSCLADSPSGQAKVGPLPDTTITAARASSGGRRKDKMIAAVMETKRGAFLVRFVGAEKAVADNAQSFISWLKSFK
jgi:hypothetical protein